MNSCETRNRTIFSHVGIQLYSISNVKRVRYTYKTHKILHSAESEKKKASVFFQGKLSTLVSGSSVVAIFSCFLRKSNSLR
jgi:hypothetical protein